MKKFSNHYQEMKRKRGVSGINATDIKGKTIQLFEEKTGRQLFEVAQKHALNKAATERRTSDESGPGKHAAHYQSVLKEMWDALDDQERLEYEQAAQDHSDDIYQYVIMNYAFNAAYTSY
jgi:hypothetical protein